MTNYPPNYNLVTGELRGQPICRYCRALLTIIPEFQNRDFHTTAKCVEGDEPMGRVR